MTPADAISLLQVGGMLTLEERNKIEVIIDDLCAINAELLVALKFFASVIKSGEPWTDKCEQTFRAAIAKAEEAK